MVAYSSRKCDSAIDLTAEAINISNSKVADFYISTMLQDLSIPQLILSTGSALSTYGHS